MLDTMFPAYVAVELCEANIAHDEEGDSEAYDGMSKKSELVNDASLENHDYDNKYSLDDEVNGKSSLCDDAKATIDKGQESNVSTSLQSLHDTETNTNGKVNRSDVLHNNDSILKKKTTSILQTSGRCKTNLPDKNSFELSQNSNFPLSDCLNKNNISSVLMSSDCSKNNSKNANVTTSSSANSYKSHSQDKKTIGVDCLHCMWLSNSSRLVLSNMSAFFGHVHKYGGVEVMNRITGPPAKRETCFLSLPHIVK